MKASKGALQRALVRWRACFGQRGPCSCSAVRVARSPQALASPTPIPHLYHMQSRVVEAPTGARRDAAKEDANVLLKEWVCWSAG